MKQKLGLLVLGIMLAEPRALPAWARGKAKTSSNRSPRKKAEPAAEVVAGPPVEAQPKPAEEEAVLPKDPPPAKPTADPAPVVEPAPPAKEPAAAPDLERLRAEYSALKDAVFRSRARRETLEDALLSTQMVVTVAFEANRKFAVKQAEITLDGVRIWQVGEGGLADSAVTLAPRSAPPGPHLLGVRAEVRSRASAQRGYVTDQTFTVSLAEGKRVPVKITIDESGGKSSYNPEIEVEVDD